MLSYGGFPMVLQFDYVGCELFFLNVVEKLKF